MKDLFDIIRKLDQKQSSQDMNQYFLWDVDVAGNNLTCTVPDSLIFNVCLFERHRDFFFLSADSLPNCSQQVYLGQAQVKNLRIHLGFPSGCQDLEYLRQWDSIRNHIL